MANEKTILRLAALLCIIEVFFPVSFMFNNHDWVSNVIVSYIFDHQIFRMKNVNLAKDASSYRNFGYLFVYNKTYSDFTPYHR